MGREPTLTRRELMQAGIAGLSVLAFGQRSSDEVGALVAERDLPKHVSLYTGRQFPAVPSTCGMCPAGCGILVFVDGRRVVGVRGNPGHPYNRGRICALGSAGVNLFNDPQRILRPLRRVGARGEGKWREIGWEEALGEIAGRFKRVRAGGGRSGRCAFFVPQEEATPFLRRFLDALGEWCVLVESGGQERAVDLEAHRRIWGSGIGVADVSRAEWILNFGANLLGSPRHLVGFSPRWIEARMDRGARLVTFDPRCSTTASASDEWIPLKSRTDGLVALAMAKVILDEGLEDKEFLRRHADGDSPRLKHMLDALDSEAACAASGVEVSTVKRLARGFAGARCGVAVYGSGVTGHETGSVNAQCVLLLNFLTGNVERAGGYCFPRIATWDDPSPVPPQTHTTSLPGTLFWDLEHGQQEVDGLFTFQANPAYEDPEPGRTEEILKNEQRIPFHVAMDSSMTETALLADLVLPACTYLERWKLASRPAIDQVPYVSLQQPAVEPLGGSRSFEDVLIDLAQRLGEGVEGYFPFQGGRAYYQAAASGVKGLAAQGGWSLLTKQGFWVGEGGEGLGAQEDVMRFNTQGGTCRLLPVVAQGISEATTSRHPEMISSGERVLLLFSVATHDDRTAGCKWLSEIHYASPIWIHPGAADELGLKEGAWVRIKSAVGEMKGRIRLTEGITQGALAIEDTAGHRGFGPLARGIAYRSEDADTMLVWWAKGVYGENPRALIAWSKDPHSQGPRWMDTVVRIDRL